MTTPDEAPVAEDGRRARGQRRRNAIIAATLAVIERDGVAGVTHRTVAREAGVVPSSALYYFATLDDLLVAALSAATEDYARQLELLRRSGHDEIDAIAEATAAAGGTGRQRAIAEWELTLMAARRPALRPVARRWRELVADAAAGYTDDPVAIEAVVVAADGLCARILLNDEPPNTDHIKAVLRHALRERAPHVP